MLRGRRFELLLHLSTVEEVFAPSGRSSLVVVPGLPRCDAQKWNLRIGMAITLEAPDGTIRETVLGGIEMASPSHPDFIPIMLGHGLTKAMVPIGTKLWVSETARV